MRSAIRRLKQRRDFLRVAAARRKWAAPGLVLQARRMPGVDGDVDESGDGCHDGCGDGEAIRVGFTASRKVGGAVARNRARRRLREAVRAVLPRHAAGGYDYVVIARAGTLTRRFSDLVRDLETALRKLGAYRAEDGRANGGRANDGRAGNRG